MTAGGSASPSTSISLIKQVRHNDPLAWQRLCRVYGPLVYRWARVAGLQDSDAADVGQEVFRTVHTRIGSFEWDDRGGSFRGWLKTITRNKVGDLLRKRSRQPLGPGGSTAWIQQQQQPDIFAEPSLDDGDLPDEPGFDSEQFILQRLLSALRDEFEARTWQAFWLTTIEDRSAAEAAEQLQISPAAVRQAKYRVLRRLRDELEPEK